MCDALHVASVRTPRLRRHLIWVIAIKVMALTALWWFFFRSELRPPADSNSVVTQIIGTQTRDTQHTD